MSLNRTAAGMILLLALYAVHAESLVARHLVVSSTSSISSGLVASNGTKETKESWSPPASTSGSSSASSGDFDSKLGDELQISLRAEAADSPYFNWAYGAGYSNASIADALCSAVNSSHLYIALSSPLDHPYLFPACFAHKAVSAVTVTLTNWAVASFASFPSALRGLNLNKCSFDPSSSEYYSSPDSSTSTPAAPVYDGFDDEGNFSWPEVWSALPALQALYTFNSILPGAKLPDVIPKRLYTISMQNAGVSGSIPTTLFSNYTESTTVPALTVNFGSNSITGTLPDALLAPLLTSGVTYLSLFLSSNSLSGSIPERFISTTLTSVSIGLANNNLNGTLPASLFENVSYFNSLVLDISNNSLSGTLPPGLFSSGLNPPTSNAIGTLSVDLSNNRFNGSIPSTFLSYNSTSHMQISFMTFLAIQSGLSGSIPADLFKNSNFSISVTSAGSISFAKNNLTGSIPERFLEVGANMATSGSLVIDLSANTLSGSLPSYCIIGSRMLSVDFRLNNISGTIPDAWQACKWSTIWLSNNSQITGSIPAKLFTNTSMSRFQAASTDLSGNLPSFPPVSFDVGLSATNIQFCSAPSLLAFATRLSGPCRLIDTATCGCESTYQGACFMSCSSSRTTTCVGPAPAANFACAGGVWTATGPINTPTLNIPSGSGPVVAIAGNLTSPSVILDGLGTTIEVSGCVTNLSTIRIELSLTETGKLETSSLQEILSLLSSNCSVDLNDVSLDVSIKGSSCKKAKVTKVISDDGSTMSGLFSIDKSGCKNRWWIILVSVICGVVLLIVIALVLMAALWPAFRAKIRPFAARNKQQGSI